ncbi:glycine betaine ABC transporter substrate-binding protein [Marinomonas sp. 5E14-1]|uniref:glycine betaine ABC transporter substrate-binding protein n=1 Tax=Marinomonas sp. 5E14-1 TaxID=3153922 RepID=UPI0032639C5D
MQNIMKKTLLASVFTFFSSVSLSAEIVVGGKNFTEQQLLTEITSQYLESKGFEIEKRSGMGSAVLRKAQENGQVDIYWEYTGTSLISYNKFKEKIPSSEVYNKVKELDAKQGLVWMAPSSANNTYAFAMQRAKSEELGIYSLSDLAKSIKEGSGLSIAVNAEFYARDDGLKPLQKTYDFKFPRKDIKRMDSGLTYTALKESKVDLALVFATDGRIPAFDFVVLKDDKNFFPDYSVVPVIVEKTLKENPKLGTLLNDISAKINDASISKLNAEVDVDKKSIESVSKKFLEENGLL